MTLRVLVVSNVRVVREGLNSVLARRGAVEVVSTVDMLHARDQSTELHPDVVLFDAARRDSVEFVKDLVASAPHSKVVAFGVKETDEEILRWRRRERQATCAKAPKAAMLSECSSR